MLVKFFLCILFTLGCSQVLEKKETVSSDDESKSLTTSPSGSNDNSSQSINTDSNKMQLFINQMSQCCFDSAKNISELENNVLKLEQDNKIFTKTINKLMKKVSELEEINNGLEQEISESNRWENNLNQYRQELDRKEHSLKEFRIKLDNEYEKQYRLRVNLNKTKKEMYQQFLQLRDQRYQVSKCMNDVTFVKEENKRENVKEKYHLAEEKGKSILYKCTSISDVGKNYLYKCLPSLNANFIPEASTEIEESSEFSDESKLFDDNI